MSILYLSYEPALRVDLFHRHHSLRDAGYPPVVLICALGRFLTNLSSFFPEICLYDTSSMIALIKCVPRPLSERSFRGCPHILAGSGGSPSSRSLNTIRSAFA